MPTQTGVQVRNLAVSLGCLFIPLFPQQTPSVTKSSWLFYIFFFFFWFVTFSLLFWYIQKNRWSRHLSLMLWLKSISLVTNIQVTKYLSASQKALLKIPPYELYFCSFTRVVSVLTCICVCVCVCVCVCNIHTCNIHVTHTHIYKSGQRSNFIYLFLAVLSLHCCTGFSLAAVSRVTLHCGTWASHCGGFSYCRALALGCVGFSSCSSWGLERRLSSCGHGLGCPKACGLFLDQGLDPCLLHW